MIHEEPWPDGTPGWADLMVPDRHAAREFYGPLLGWEFDEGSPETGYYTTATLDGHAAAGIGTPLPGTEAPPPAWTTYLAASDLEGAAARATAAGATLLMPPMTVMGFGAMAVLADPTGAVVGLWQAGSHTGFDVVGVPGAVVWSEHMGTDSTTARAFYASLFDYQVVDMSGPGFDYVSLQLGDREVAGIGQFGASMPSPTGDLRPSWSTYFGVLDCDASTALATSLGGTVLSAPEDTPYGRIAVLHGRFGETFALLAEIPAAS
ncbi:VOC family protein [Cellulomonas sp. NS3]|uniref:VOC family protein n=1 Tax=Cellulomonas sp. NS3 TaxID=2973977 RepID=UPI0021616829|nr:VOC family protein [Cellulomonas sp. NS3]